MARHTVMNRQNVRELRIPDLMGGLNTRDSLSMINDNQLTDCLNVWWHDGVLRTRPGVADKDMNVGVVGYIESVDTKQTDVYIGGYKLCYSEIMGTRKNDDNPDTTTTFSETVFWLQSGNKIIHLPKLTLNGISFICQKGKTVYAFLKSNQIFINDIYFENGGINLKTWKEITEEEIYKPLVYTNCLTDGAGDSFEGVQLEGFSLLTPWVRMVYSNVNRKLLNASNKDDTHDAIYSVPFECFNYNELDKCLIVQYTTPTGVIAEHKVDTKNEQGTWEETTANQVDGMAITAYRTLNQTLVIYFVKVGSIGREHVAWTASDYLENSIEIEIKTNDKSYLGSKQKVFNMTQSAWFGGDAAGISGGTRLFLCGNTTEEEKALVLWSGLNNPLYFSENCYAYVGNENQAVTCFGKQGETLVMFKENGAGTYYTQYIKAKGIEASDLINQSVVDYNASNVYFPIVTLHPTIGCDCPNSVQLCRNRLVWACSDGNVYTLANQSQFSERNIFSVSEMINQKLKKEIDLKNSVSADWQGHYLLFTKERVYVMDYESYGYAYVSSHTKTENAQTKIPWWYWELGQNINTVVSLNDKLFAVFYEDNDLLNELLIKEFDTEKSYDSGKPINVMLQTKLFDFSMPSRKKNLHTVNLSMGNNQGNPIKVEFITEHGTEEQEIVLDSNETEIKQAGYIRNKAVYPCIKAVKRFGVKLSCDGEIVTDGMIFNFTILGGVR